MSDLTKPIALGFAGSIGSEYLVNNVLKEPYLRDSIDVLLYGGAALSFVIGFVSKEHWSLIPFSVSLAIGTLVYNHYLARYLGVRRFMAM